MSRIQVVLSIQKNDLNILCTESKIAQTRVLYSKKKTGLFVKNKQIYKEENIIEFINLCQEELEIILGHKVTKVLVSLEMNDLKIQRTEKEMKVINDVGAVTESDINNLKSLANNVIKEEGYEMVYSKPFRYILDKKNILYGSPLRYRCKSLAIDMIIYSANSSLMLSLRKLELKTKIQFKIVMPSQFGVAFESSSELELKEGICISKINYSSTTVSYFRKGCLVSTKTIKHGFNDIIKSIAKKLRVNQKIAHALYSKIALALTSTINEYDIYETYDDYDQVIKRFTNLDIAKIAELEIISIYNFIDKVAQEISPKPVRVINTGLLAKNKSCAKLLKKLETETQMRNYIPNTLGATEHVFTTCLGLAYFCFINIDADETETLLKLPVYKQQYTVREKFNSFFKRVIGIN